MKETGGTVFEKKTRCKVWMQRCGSRSLDSTLQMLRIPLASKGAAWDARYARKLEQCNSRKHEKRRRKGLKEWGWMQGGGQHTLPGGWKWATTTHKSAFEAFQMPTSRVDFQIICVKLPKHQRAEKVVPFELTLMPSPMPWRIIYTLYTLFEEPLHGY